MTHDICNSCGKPWPSCEGRVCIDCEESVTSPYNLRRMKNILCASMLKSGVAYPEFYRCSGKTRESIIKKLVIGGTLINECILPELIGMGYVNTLEKKFIVAIRERISLGEINEVRIIADNQRAHYGFIVTTSDSREVVDWIIKGKRNILTTSNGGDIFIGQVDLSKGEIEKWSPSLQF